MFSEIALNGPGSLWALFLSAFVSATLFTGGSEAVLAMLAHGSDHNLPLLLFIGTLGNTLGGMTTWGLGWLLARRFPAQGMNDRRRERAVDHLRRWGSPALLLSWLPVIGDPLCFAAGWLRIHWLPALLFIAAGKAARYAAVIILAQ
ncbi:MAG: DedA family protein [Gammaproteobacteria bacterium]